MKFSTLVLILLFSYNAKSQAYFDVQTSIGIASENNIGDTGLRLSTKVSRNVGRWAAFAQVGTFQMFKSNEDWTADQAYLELRSLSTFNLDLGGSYAFVKTYRFNWSVNAAGAYRTGRQLWPELLVGGNEIVIYTYEKVKDFGYAFGTDFSVKASKRVWLGVNAHCHSYNFFGEYFGAGLHATIVL